ncbi:unnamed protein product [Diamesa tonsa]
MKCILGLLVVATCALMTSAYPARNGMVFYQTHANPGYYNNHRAIVMQYASQPIKYRAAQATGVSAFSSGKRVAAGTYLKQAELVEDEDQFPTQQDEEEGNVQSVAEAYPEGDDEQNDDEEEQQTVYRIPANKVPKQFVPAVQAVPAEDEAVPEAPTRFVPNKNRKTPVQVQDDEEDEEDIPVRKNSNRGNQQPSQLGGTYFPVSFGSTNGGAIAIANSFSTGKGGSASSRATAYGSPSKANKRPTKH